MGLWCYVFVITLAQFVMCEKLKNPKTCMVNDKHHCVYVDCSNRSLTYVPLNLPSSTCKLNLNKNVIPKLFNYSLSTYPNLTSLTVSSNMISEMEAGSFIGLGKLKVLDLSKNLLTDVPLYLPSSICELNLTKNFIPKVLNDSLSMYPNLTSLHVSSNNVSEMEAGSFIGLGKLKVLDLSKNLLTDVPLYLPSSICELNLNKNFIPKLLNGSLSTYPNLTLLSMSSNVLFEMEARSFISLWKLRVLDLSNNNLSFANTTESVFSPLIMLENLDIRNNTYLRYPQSVLSHLTSLENLNMDGLMMPLGKGFRNLTKLAHLSLSGSKGICSIDYLSDIFEDVPNIISLDLSYCNICTVKTGALSYLHNIETLNMSGNMDLGLEGIKNVTLGLQNSRLKKLVISQIVGEHTIGVMVLPEHIQHLQNSSLEWLEANDNRIEIFDEDVFSLLPKSLKYANVRSSRFTYGKYLWHLQNLTGLIHLDLSGRPGVRNLPFADTDDDSSDRRISTSSSSPPPGKECSSRSFNSEGHDYQFAETNLRYKKSYGYHNNIPVILTKGWEFGIPPNLVKFKYSNALLAFELSKIHISKNNLKHVDLSFNIFTTWKGPIDGLENITHLDLSGNVARKVYPDFFANFHSLKVLNITNNFLSNSLYDNHHGIFFRNQQKLEVLDMSQNNIVYLNLDIFKGLKSLRVLNISGNHIYNLSINFEHNKNLTHINCADNNIKWIEPYGRMQMSKLAESNPLWLDLSHNALRCSCETLDFLDWFLVSSNIRHINLNNAFCINDNNQKLQLDSPGLLGDMKASCRSYFGLSMGSMAAFVFIISLMVSAISYRYRWRLTYWYYIAKLKLKKRIPDQTPEQFDFDMYVAYADSDLDFVCRDMINKMETQRGARLYIRDRDSLPGAPIAENIIDGIRRSKKTILLLSKTFLKKKWCRYELHMANMESVSTGRDVMVIVMLEDIPNKDIPPVILCEVQNSRFIDYPQDGNELEHFWANMHTSIQI